MPDVVTILLRMGGSMFILTSVPLGLFVGSRKGAWAGAIVFLPYCSLGFFLQMMADRRRGVGRHGDERTFLYAIISSFLFVMLLAIGVIVYFFLLRA